VEDAIGDVGLVGGHGTRSFEGRFSAPRPDRRKTASHQLQRLSRPSPRRAEQVDRTAALGICWPKHRRPERAQSSQCPGVINAMPVEPFLHFTGDCVGRTLEHQLALAQQTVPPSRGRPSPNRPRQFRARAQVKVTPSRATIRPRFTTVRRAGRCATASATVSASTNTRSPPHPGASP
jgi:hypothetical protein